MAIAKYFTRRLGKHVIRTHAGYDGKGLPRGILIVDGQTHPREDYLCIVAGNALDALLDGAVDFENRYFMLTADAAAGYDAIAGREETSVWATDLDLAPLYNRLQDAVGLYASSRDNRTFEGASFADFIHNVLARKLVEDREILEAFRDFPTTVDLSYRVLIFQFDDTEAADRSMSVLIRKLHDIFLRINVANYFGRAVAIVQPPDWDHDDMIMPAQQYGELNALCTQLGCRCAMGNPCLNWQILRTELHIVKNTLQVAPLVGNDPEQRLYYSEDYMTYLTMGWCMRTYIEEYQHDNYLYLVHPGVAQIIRYDQENDSDLRNVLYGYLLNECNASKTAEALYMHRNTVVYKIKKIEKLLTVKLNDPVVRERVLWSCMMSRYCENVLGIMPDRFKGYGVTGRHPVYPKAKPDDRARSMMPGDDQG